MGEVVRYKHFIWAIGCMLVYAFILGWNVKSKMNLVDNNTDDIIELKTDVKVLQETTNENYIKILLKLNQIELKLKDKEDRE